MEIYNTLTRKKEKFEPRRDLPAGKAGKKVRMFVCGPTVYDYIHIGNARTFVFFDVVAKYLRYRGYEVDYIQNITDIDNKIIERAQKEGADPLEYAKKYSDIFKEDMKALGITSPEYKNATDHIPEVIKQVQTLLDKGNAYPIENDGIYFDLSTFPDYGKLSGRTASMADDAVSRIDDSDKKRNRGDFALWKFAQHNDPSWPAPFGDGRPGWHIEDTAITEKYFGPQYDIHGGGEDLKFPHHEAEIAQQESASGLKPFVKYWMHSGFLVNKAEKMSKSAGNFMTLRDTLKIHPSEILRYNFLSSHYRSPLELSFESDKDPEKIVGTARISGFITRLNHLQKNNVDNPSVYKVLSDTKNKFEESMSDDFNTAEALGSVFDMIRKLNPLIDLSQISQKQKEEIFEFLKHIDTILGIIPKETQDLDDFILDLIQQRRVARVNKNYEKSDELRNRIEERGYEVLDTENGIIVSPKK